MSELSLHTKDLAGLPVKDLPLKACTCAEELKHYREELVNLQSILALKEHEVRRLEERLSGHYLKAVAEQNGAGDKEGHLSGWNGAIGEDTIDGHQLESLPSITPTFGSPLSLLNSNLAFGHGVTEGTHKIQEEKGSRRQEEVGPGPKMPLEQVVLDEQLLEAARALEEAGGSQADGPSLNKQVSGSADDIDGSQKTDVHGNMGDDGVHRMPLHSKSGSQAVNSTGRTGLDGSLKEAGLVAEPAEIQCPAGEHALLQARHSKWLPVNCSSIGTQTMEESTSACVAPSQGRWAHSEVSMEPGGAGEPGVVCVEDGRGELSSEPLSYDQAPSAQLMTKSPLATPGRRRYLESSLPSETPGKGRKEDEKIRLEEEEVQEEEEGNEKEIEKEEVEDQDGKEENDGGEEMRTREVAMNRASYQTGDNVSDRKAQISSDSKQSHVHIRRLEVEINHLKSQLTQSLSEQCSLRDELEATGQSLSEYRDVTAKDVRFEGQEGGIGWR